jgi:alkanesulfonate monooxygenase SsuD/methylene tetrahydromethanopterin reductase-like flavin-dependent oxidoreductase (luciferase family)
MRFGVFDHMDRGAGPLSRFFEDRLRLVETYDRAGFYGYHVAEHHATPLGLAPSPSVWLAAISQRTRALRFGPLVYTLPLYHPLRVIDEICMLDQMSGGRLLLGVGRGISPIELGYWGLNAGAAPAMYQEALEIVLRGLGTRQLSFEGEYYTYKDVPIELEPLQKPHPPLWYGIGRLDSIPWAARRGVHVVANLPPSMMRPLTDRYRAEWAELGRPAEDLPFMGVSRHIVMADTDAEALAIARRGYRMWRESFFKLWLKHGQLPTPNAIFPPEFDEAEAQGRAVAGTPAKLRDVLRGVIAESGINYLLCRFAFGDISGEEALRSVDLFAREVMPALS